MRVGMIKILLFVVALIGSVLANTTGLDAADRAIRVGYIVPLSGPQASQGGENVNAVKLYLEETKMTLGGRKVEVFYEDTKFQPAPGLEAVKKLVGLNKIDLLMGLQSTGVAYAIRDYIIENKVPLIISCACSAQDLTMDPKKISPYIFRTTYNASAVATVPADWMFKHGNARKAICLTYDYSGGYEWVGFFSQHFKELGGEIVQEVYVPFGTMDFSPYLNTLDPSADSIYVVLFGSEGVRFINQMGERRLNKKYLVAGIGPYNEMVLQELGENALGGYQVGNYFSNLETPGGSKFQEAFHAKYKTRAAVIAENGYAGMKIVDETLKSIGGKIENTDLFLNALRNIKVSVPRGPVYFDKFQNVVQNMYMGRVDPAKGREKNWGYSSQHNVVSVYENIDQFWPWTEAKRDEMLAISGKKGTWAKKKQ